MQHCSQVPPPSFEVLQQDDTCIGVEQQGTHRKQMPAMREGMDECQLRSLKCLADQETCAIQPCISNRCRRIAEDLPSGTLIFQDKSTDIRVPYRGSISHEILMDRRRDSQRSCQRPQAPTARSRRGQSWQCARPGHACRQSAASVPCR